MLYKSLDGGKYVIFKGNNGLAYSVDDQQNVSEVQLLESYGTFTQEELTAHIAFKQACITENQAIVDELTAVLSLITKE